MGEERREDGKGREGEVKRDRIWERTLGRGEKKGGKGKGNGKMETEDRREDGEEAVREEGKK